MPRDPRPGRTGLRAARRQPRPPRSLGRAPGRWRHSRAVRAGHHDAPPFVSRSRSVSISRMAVNRLPNLFPPSRPLHNSVIAMKMNRAPPTPSFPRRACPRADGGGNPSPCWLRLALQDTHLSRACQSCLLVWSGPVFRLEPESPWPFRPQKGMKWARDSLLPHDLWQRPGMGSRLRGNDGIAEAGLCPHPTLFLRGRGGCGLPRTLPEWMRPV